MHLCTAIFGSSRRKAIGVMLLTSIVATGCTTNYLTNSTEGTYGVPMTERTIPQRLLDRAVRIRHRRPVFFLVHPERA